MPPNNKEIPPVDPIHYVKEGVSAMGELLKVAGNNPNAQVAGDNIAQAALTVTKLVNNCLLPIAAVNFAFDKARPARYRGDRKSVV